MDKKTLAILASLSVAAQKRNADRRKYDVFLGSRGLDTRNGFTDHLYNGLVAARFTVFKDDCELVGKQIGLGLIQAIENCKIAIPIISKRYADGTWCLTELTLIVRRHAEQGLLVFPVFYEVNVFDVCRQDPTTEFGKAFNELARHHKPGEVREWRETLRSVTMIRGWTSQHVSNGRQGQLVKMVVGKVSSELRTPWIERIPMFQKERKESAYQAFLIFSPSTEKGFASALSHGIRRKEVNVLLCEDQSLIGKDFAREICKTIRCCKIYIPIFTEDFASSRSCLDNLAQIIECGIPNGRKILPIFYKVNPSQKQEVFDLFWKDMLQHKDPQGENTYNRWHRALDLVWSLRGWVLENIDKGNEGKLVKMVVKEVLALLKNPNPWSPSTEYQLNMDSKL